MVAHTNGIALKKKFGQHFLRDERILTTITNAVEITNSSVFEIGCGDGALTRAILTKDIARLWVFEIDPEWAQFVQAQIKDARMTLYNHDILQVDFSVFKEHAPWVLLANLPYQVTFPILHLLHKHRAMLREAVIMVQEEVAQKLMQTGGRGYGFSALFFQHFFEMRLLTKVPPTAFVPPPKVTSRLMYLKPHALLTPIPDEERFWQFIQICFRQPRRMIKHNIAQSIYDVARMPESIAMLRAQQMSMHDLLALWDLLRG